MRTATSRADNEVTVTTERALYGPVIEEIIWGEPNNETNKTVNIEDISDLFGRSTSAP
jgi:hypothetical protein